jgi:glycosyltransferase involved in cell wall biosynthesis
MKRIVMLGSAKDVRGGVSAMVNVYEAEGLFERTGAEYIATHCDGSRARKLERAARAWFAFMGRLLTGRVSLLHVHLASDASFWRKSAFVVPAHALGVPYVIHMHGGDFLEFYRDACRPAVQRFIRHMLRNARSVIALSREGRAALLAIEPAADVVQIPNPVAIPGWQARLDASAPTVLFLGVIKPAKGCWDLLRAWPKVAAAVPGARLVLAGSGAIDEARAMASDLGVAGSVLTPGWTAGADKEALMREAWLFTLPSHWEALPMSVLESMAAGLPVVASDVGGIPMAVGDGGCGILVKPRDEAALADALVAVLSDAGRRKAMGKAARERATAEFSAPSIVPRIEALWAAILRPADLRMRPCASSKASRSSTSPASSPAPGPPRTSPTSAPK